ncbi:MAG: hypothetical protein HFJ17_00790 [Clostridia bacterium]|nr:hypothetical protein [Clostridia bacterium]
MNLSLNVPKGFVCTNMEQDSIEEIYENFDKLNLNKVAVRSSAICEDSKENSFAGQFETILNVNKENLIDSIKKCFDSSKNLNVIEYAEEKEVNKSDMKVSVIVQEMIASDISGVMFTTNPINGSDEIVIECVKGLGESLVQGEITPSQVIVDRSGNINRYLGEKILPELQIEKLTSIAKCIENHFMIPQDIEWAIKNDEIYILQARPITNII